MATEAKKASSFAACTAPAGADSVLTLTTSTVANNALTTVAQLLGNSSANVVVANGSQLIVAGSNTPANSTALVNVVKGTIWFDTDNIYVATAHGIVRSAALADFPGSGGGASLPDPSPWPNRALLTNGGSPATAFWGNDNDSSLLVPISNSTHSGQILRLDTGGTPVWATQYTHVVYPINETDLLAATTQYLTFWLDSLAICDYVAVVIQKTVTTGGTLTFKNAGQTFMTLTVTDGATAGTIISDFPTSHNTSLAGAAITIVPVGFASAGAVNIVFGFASSPLG